MQAVLIYSPNAKELFGLLFIVKNDFLDLNNLHQLMPLSHTENNETIEEAKDCILFHNRECTK